MIKVNILIIDDDKHFLNLTKASLEGAACLEEIKCVNHAKDAREYLDSCSEK